MKYIVYVLFLLSISSHTNAQATLTDISLLKWDKRIILANGMLNKEYTLTLFENQAAEINDRDIVWFIINDEQIRSNYAGHLSENFLNNTRNSFNVDPSSVILIGKDGGVKARFAHLNLESIFLKIDAMPMRQFEMQN